MKTFAPGCWTLVVLLSVVSSYSSADETLSLEKIGQMGEAGTALVEIQDRLGRGFGSAFCIHSSGLFITNNHVAQGEITIILNAGLKTEKSYKAKVVRSDKEMDLALLRIEGVKDLPTLGLGSDEKLKRLMQVVAVGFPYGDALAPKGVRYPEVSTNSGKISSLWHNKDNDALLDRIQLDVTLNPGNSGGPILDKNGKVVGVVQGGIRGAGVNFAIPVNIVTRFVARPDIHFEPPQLGAANIHKPVLFEAKVLPVIKPTKPITVELVLKAGNGKERRFPMEAASDDKYHARVVPLPPPDGAPVRVLAKFESSLLNATTADLTFKVGAREVKFTEVAKIQFQPAAHVFLQDGKELEGVVSGLEAVPVRLGEQSVVVDLGKAAEVRFGPAVEVDEVSYTLVVRQGDKEIVRQTETLPVEGFLPPHDEATGQKGFKATEYSSAMYGGKLHLFKRSSSGKLMTRSFDPQKTEWTKWQQLGDKVITSPPSALSTPTQLVVFFRGIDGKLCHVFQNYGNGWGDFFPIGDREIKSGPTAVMVGLDMTVFAHGKRGKLMKIYYDRAKGWTDWREVE